MKIKRDIYLNQLIDRKNNGLVKIVSGIIEINLDDVKQEKYRDPTVFYDYIESKTKNSKKRYYILLDEVQMMNKFESVLNGLLILGLKDFLLNTNSLEI